VGRDSSVSLATGYGLDGPGIESQKGRDFSHMSKSALGPTQPTVKWVLAPRSRGCRTIPLPPLAFRVCYGVPLPPLSTLDGPEIRVKMNILRVNTLHREHELLPKIYLKMEIQYDPEKSYMIKINVIMEKPVLSFFLSSFFLSFFLLSLTSFYLFIEGVEDYCCT
jgi:hypothetical protein